MAKWMFFLLSVILMISLPSQSNAHFGLLLPDSAIVESQSDAHLKVIAAFCHPFELGGMDLEMPQRFGVYIHKQEQDLKGKLKKTTFLGHKAWRLDFSIRRPGDYIFYMIPQPYWEQMEEKYIQHITKVIVNAYGLEDQWDKPIGLSAEIIPLTRPYGLWAGNTFCAKVIFDGKPAAEVEVEVERLNNSSPKLKAPKGAFVTQVLKTNQQGEFCYTMPVSGWWGFSALHEKENALKHDGKLVPLEIGAVIWIKAAPLSEE